jgi:LysM repeat protein
MRKTRPLYVGERLKIAGDLREAVPGSKQGEKNTPQVKRDKRAYRTYKVKQGDTLLDIAQEQGITVATLLELNRMKLDDPLYRGRILILGDDRNP